MRNQTLVSVILLFTSLFPALPAAAQVTTVDMELRVNPLLSYGFRDPLYAGEKPGYFTMNRTRLIADYSHSGKLDAQMIIQDRRAWGELNNSDTGELSLFRGWAELYLNQHFSLRIGRQGLVYDDQHLFGERNWAGILAHDALKAKYEKNNLKVHLILSESANRVNEFKRAPLEQNFYKSLQMLWAHKTWKKGKSSWLFINKGDEKPDTTNAYIQTFGTNTTVEVSNKLSAKGIYYRQMGRNTLDQRVSAYFWSLQFMWKPNDNWQTTLGVETISGGDVSAAEDRRTDRRFDRHFALLHGHLGYLDLIYVLRRPVYGIQDYYLKADRKLNQHWSIRNHLHAFITEEDAYAESDTGFTNQLNSLVGIEDDFQLRYKKDNWASFALGYSVMFGTETMDEMFGGRPIDKMHMYYLVLTVRPKLFRFDWRKEAAGT